MATAPETLAHEYHAPSITGRRYPFIPALFIIMGDTVTLSFAAFVCVIVRKLLGGAYELPTYSQLWPVLGLFVVTYALYGLYPGVVFNPVMEIRAVAAATTTVYLILGVLTFMLRVSEEYSRIVFIVAWLMSMALVPPARMILRRCFCHKSWWGYRTLVLIRDRKGEEVLRTLERHSELGLRVTAVLQYEPSPEKFDHAAPVFQGWEKAPILASHYGITHAILAVPGFSAQQLRRVLDSHARPFSHLFVIPDLEGLSSLGIGSLDLGHVLALEVSNRLLLSSAATIKRLIDLLVSVTLGIALLPVILFIALLIKLESRGPVFYGHLRIGRHEDHFKVWKFRSMVVDADAVLGSYLKERPELKEEWMRGRKLRNDPRMTRVGRFLRRTSLDELPQLWNVVKGEMSLVGPRPIVPEEIPAYDHEFGLYAQVLPGITGLWQVSGRNDTTYQERVALDTYYVRNWSPWLDVYILARTVQAVCGCRGAY
ncbi:MAG TPA: undecaprenyl-phosphate galactose phosphotransferase WbaP [Bryobacteraceae bacterium]|nr:undecaprenyl-phosphate galactose phosphotransferase WbaP [Bryobacteraceae bacterium]